MKKVKINEGYGFIGNISKLILFENILSEDKAKEYREYLKKENRELYDDFSDFEKLMKEHN